MIWYKTQNEKDDIIVSTRIRLARNLADYPFPNNMSQDQLTNAKNKIYSALEAEKGLFEKGIKKLEMSDVDKAERRVMVEKHLISRELADKNTAAVVTGLDDELSIMLMEEDHIRLQVIKGGFALKEAYQMASSIDDAIERHCDWAFSEKVGYLTACPTNTGTGLRASVMMHLPALTMTGNIDRIIASASKLGLAVRGLYGEGSKAYGAMYQLSNQITLGSSEEEIIDKLADIAGQIKKHEEEMRAAIKDKPEVCDRLWRSLATLRYARRLSSQEAKALLSDCILGRALGIIDEKLKQNPVELMVLTEPAHIQKIALGEELTPDERDLRRADLMRTAI